MIQNFANSVGFANIVRPYARYAKNALIALANGIISATNVTSVKLVINTVTDVDTAGLHAMDVAGVMDVAPSAKNVVFASGVMIF